MWKIELIYEPQGLDFDRRDKVRNKRMIMKGLSVWGFELLK